MPDHLTIDTAARTVTVADAKARLDELLASVQRGEEWLIVTADGQTIAKLEPVPPPESPAVGWPDFMARLREQWPNGTPGQPLSEIVDEGRGPRS